MFYIFLFYFGIGCFFITINLSHLVLNDFQDNFKLTCFDMILMVLQIQICKYNNSAIYSN